MMFSGRARDAMRRRGGSAGLRILFAESLRDAAMSRRAERRAVSAAVRVACFSAVIFAVAGVAFARATGAAEMALPMAVWTLAGGVATALLVAGTAGLFTAAPGSPARATLGLANALTLLRFTLVAPAVVLIGNGAFRAALVVYVVLALTDIADGIVARRRNQTGRFGAVMDPVGDVVSTFAVFTALLAHGLVPHWVYVLLCVRYAMLLAGFIGLFLATGPLDVNATPAGKIVGVVQACGAALILATAPGQPPAPGVLFAFLGLGFASIVGSQVVLGWRHVRRAQPGKR